MKRAHLLIALLIAVFMFAGAKFGSVHTDLANQVETAKERWSEVDGALKARAGLIVTLGEAVKGREAYDEAAAARSVLGGPATAQEKIRANERLTAAHAKLVALAEKNPKLAASRHYERLEDEIASAENTLAVERRKYNESLEHYNAQIQRFPDNIVAILSGYKRNDAYITTGAGSGQF